VYLVWDHLSFLISFSRRPSQPSSYGKKTPLALAVGYSSPPRAAGRPRSPPPSSALPPAAHSYPTSGTYPHTHTPRPTRIDAPRSLHPAHRRSPSQCRSDARRRVVGSRLHGATSGWIPRSAPPAWPNQPHPRGGAMAGEGRSGSRALDQIVTGRAPMATALTPPPNPALRRRPRHGCARVTPLHSALNVVDEEEAEELHLHSCNIIDLLAPTLLGRDMDWHAMLEQCVLPSTRPGTVLPTQLLPSS
jgi:hypothetical protein